MGKILPEGTVNCAIIVLRSCGNDIEMGDSAK